MNTKFRGLYFLGITIGIAVLILFGMYLFNSTAEIVGVNTVGTGTTMTKGTHTQIEKRISEINTSTVSPMLYNQLLLEINSNAEQKLFNEAIKKMLINQLDKQYQQMAFVKIDNMLLRDPIHTAEIQSFTSHLQSVYGSSNNLKAVEVKLSNISYYSNSLPQKVNVFIQAGFSAFDNAVFIGLKKELQDLPRLDGALKKKQSILKARNDALHRLNTFYQNYQSWNRAILDSN